LRRQSYDLNEDGLFNVEYADVLGIPFDFTAKPVVAPPQPPRETIQVKAVRPERDALEIRFPRVAGYRVELPEERLTAEFNEDSVLELTPDLVGAPRRKIPASLAKKSILTCFTPAKCGFPRFCTNSLPTWCCINGVNAARIRRCTFSANSNALPTNGLRNTWFAKAARIPPN